MAEIKKQEKNTYSIKPFENEKLKVDEDETEVAFGTGKATPTILNSEEEVHNWNNTRNLTVNDFVYYLNNRNDKELKEMCEKKIKRIESKNEKFKFVMDKLMKEAEEIIASDRRREKEKDEKKFNETIREMIEKHDDIVLKVNNELVFYQEYIGERNDVKKIIISKKKIFQMKLE